MIKRFECDSKCFPRLFKCSMMVWTPVECVQMLLCDPLQLFQNGLQCFSKGFESLSTVFECMFKHIIMLGWAIHSAPWARIWTKFDNMFSQQPPGQAIATTRSRQTGFRHLFLVPMLSGMLSLSGPCLSGPSLSGPRRVRTPAPCWSRTCLSGPSLPGPLKVRRLNTKIMCLGDSPPLLEFHTSCFNVF